MDFQIHVRLANYHKQTSTQAHRHTSNMSHVHPSGLFEYASIFAEVCTQFQAVRYYDCKLLKDVSTTFTAGMVAEEIVMFLDTFDCALNMKSHTVGEFNLIECIRRS